MPWPRDREKNWSPSPYAVSPHDDAPRWPWPVNRWFIPAFWLTIVFVACLAWFG